MKNKIKSLSCIILALTLAFISVVFSSCGKKESEKPEEKASEITTENTSKKWIIATDILSKPFEFTDENNNLAGIDIDILKAIAEDRNFDYEFQAIGFEEGIKACKEKKADAFMADASITQDRIDEGWIFSDPYFTCKHGVAVSDASAIKSYDDLKGKTVAVQSDTVNAKFAQSIREKYGFSIQQFDSSPIMYQAVAYGQVDACIDDTILIEYEVKAAQGALNIHIVESTVSDDGDGIGAAVFSEENKEFITMFNQGLKNIKANGKYDEIINKYTK